jgi:ADP-ribosylglycohydrolase
MYAAEMKIRERFAGCILGGAIGDAMGSSYENQVLQKKAEAVFYPFGKPAPPSIPPWQLTDDTQLTLATCEAIVKNGKVDPEGMAQHFLELYTRRKLTGLGASTLQALQALAVGGHWSQVGRRGEYAAGNGAAMRIAPLAFVSTKLNRKEVEEVSKLTHHNDEAYAGALSIVIGLQAILTKTWTGAEDLLALIAARLPDTKLKDRLLAISQTLSTTTIQQVGKQFGSSGYVAESVPLALFAASKVTETGFKRMLEELIAVGGDTDTNCSLAGQLAGTLVGPEGIPITLKDKLLKLNEYDWIQQTIADFTQWNGWE